LANVAKMLIVFIILLAVLSFLLSKFLAIGEILAEKFLKLFSYILPSWIDAKWILSSPFWLIYSAVFGVVFIFITVWVILKIIE